MPFGLKYAGATYQRLMDKIFEKQARTNVEVYVDNILVKSKGKSSFILDLEETFSTLRKLREKLLIYLSATEYAVSLVLIQEERTDQNPVYYASHALRGPELRYTELEKIALSLIITTRKLRPYFLSHPIIVLTSSSLGKIMNNPDILGRLVEWTIELWEYDITYQPRTAIKAQALSDFLIEMAQSGKEEVGRVFVDGAAYKEGSGVEVVLVSSTGEKIKYAVRLDFRASNNEAE
ncbi:uncharacterized protein [Primulina huaijiensis]|uniref:uncharacterized protein n=1 Tax=Primulina huaijiensis TaxID=1492673 RepID=UPI003CC71611